MSLLIKVSGIFLFTRDAPSVLHQFPIGVRS